MTTQTEALNIALDYMNERLEDHDYKYQRHPATEAERINILADIETVKEALAQPEPSPEWMTEEEQTAYTFGWFKALESKRMAQPEQRSVSEHLEPVAWIQPNHLQKARQAPFLCRVEPKQRDDFVPLYTTPPQRKEPEQEPVAWRFQSAVGGWAYGKEPPVGSKYAVEPLYTTPPQEQRSCDMRTWVGLTDEEREQMVDMVIADKKTKDQIGDLQRMVEDKLKEKNT